MKVKISGVLPKTATLLSLAVSTALCAAPQTDDLSAAVKSQLNLPTVTSKKSEQPKRYIVKYKKSGVSTSSTQSSVTAYSSVKNSMATLGATIKADYPSSGIFSVEGSDAVINALKLDPNVEYVEEDVPRYLMAETHPFGLAQVQADQVIDTDWQTSNMKVCIIDTGIDANHPDLADNNLTGTNDIGTGNWYEDENSHGTHVAGTIAALSNDAGVVGVMPNGNINIHIIKVFDENGWAYSSTLGAAVERCDEAGANVISMSLGGPASNLFESNLFKDKHNNKNIILVAAAGNDGNTSLSYPASYSSVVSVAAIDSQKVIAEFSQQNSQVEIAGPGVAVLSTVPESSGLSANLSTTTVDGVFYATQGMENLGNVSAPLYDFQFGFDIDNGAAGKVCLISRGDTAFSEKAKNCEDSGGVGAIIYNNVPGQFGGSLGDPTGSSIPVVATSDTSGAAMLQQLGKIATINMENLPGYAYFSGTSMATPHVSAVTALVWGHNLNCTAQEVRAALNATAEDLGNSGKDNAYGYGLVQAKAAHDMLNNSSCGDGHIDDEAPGEGPIRVDFTASCDSSRKCSFDASATEGDFDIVSYEWELGDDTTASGVTAEHTYDANDRYKITLTVTDSEDNVVSKTRTVNASFPDYVLENGVAKTGVNGNSGQMTRFQINIPAGSTDLRFTTRGGSGNLNLYVAKNYEPTTGNYDCRSGGFGTSETCIGSTTTGGTYHVGVYGYITNFSDVIVTASFTPPPAPGNGKETERTNITINSGSPKYYFVDVPFGMATFTVTTSDGNGDLTLYVRRGAQPTATRYDCRVDEPGSTEEVCHFDNPTSGRWHIALASRVSQTTGVTLRTSSKPPQ